MADGTPPAAPGPLEATRRRLGLSTHDVWIGYFEVGGNGSPADVAGWLADESGLPAREHDFLAQSLNDVSVDRGLNHPVPYRVRS
jgi:hypothetical protein